MEDKFEDMVKLIHGFQIKGARGQIERRQEELRRAEDRLQVLQKDDSEARRSVKEMLDLFARVKAQA